MKNNLTLIGTIFTILMLLGMTTVMRAQCVIPVTPNQPFVEDFEGNFFDCWTTEDVGAGHWAKMTGTTSSVASFSYSNPGDESRLISPTLDLSGSSTAVFSFSYAMMGLYNTDELVVGYRTSETDPWHDLGTFSVNDWSNYYEQTYEIANPTATLQVSFLGRGIGGYYIFVDNVEVASIAGCSRPLSLQATDLTPFSALLSWSTTGNEEHWVIELNGQEKTVDSQPYLAQDLTPQTTYTCRVKADCGNGLMSDWSTPITFTTRCDVITVTDEEPFYDDFEASDYFVCWINEITTGTDGWVVDPGYLFPNHTAFFIWMGGDALLISPPLNMTAVSHPCVEFKRRQQQGPDYGNTDELSVWYRPTLDDEWRMLDFYITPAEDWEAIRLALPEVTDKCQVAFLGVGHDGEGVYVDDVMIGNDATWSVEATVALKATALPNPALDRVVIAATVDHAEVALFDLTGRKVLSTTLTEGRAELDLSRLAQGVYTARVSSNEGFTTVRLVKE